MARIGYLAPATNFDGIVHSVFAHACNVEGPAGLLTISAHASGDGPTVWRLASDPRDLRRLFRRGERLHRRYSVATTGSAVVDLSTAETWRPPPSPPRAGGALVANLQVAFTALERRRRRSESVVHREAAPTLRSLAEACRALDVGRATSAIDRLVGWGEGLTPAGDDAVVGFLAAIRALAAADAKHLAFAETLSAAVAARAAQTTDISAHYLRLAAQGHFNADVTRLVHALVGGESGDGPGVPAVLHVAPDASLAAASDAALDLALAAALDVGATSGADMVAGMMAGCRASCPANA